MSQAAATVARNRFAQLHKTEVSSLTRRVIMTNYGINPSTARNRAIATLVQKYPQEYRYLIEEAVREGYERSPKDWHPKVRIRHRAKARLAKLYPLEYDKFLSEEKKKTPYDFHTTVRRRALTRISKLYPLDYDRLVKEEREADDAARAAVGLNSIEAEVSGGTYQITKER